MKHQVDDLTCSFCNKSQDEVSKLIAGPKHYICEKCVDRVSSIMLSEDSGTDKASKRVVEGEVRCSFCGKRAIEVWNLVTESGSNVCSECVEVCNEILRDERYDLARSEAAIVELNRLNKVHKARKSFLKRIGIG